MKNVILFKELVLESIACKLTTVINFVRVNQNNLQHV